jgi:diaminopimelate epimerase
MGFGAGLPARSEVVASCGALQTHERALRRTLSSQETFFADAAFFRAMSLHFVKYHALGNDYIVLDPTRGGGGEAPAPALVEAICDRNRGVGSDGILYGPERDAEGRPTLRIFNPDGSEAEKSGNGIRIFAHWLRAAGHVSGPFDLAVGGSTVRVSFPGESVVRVAMGVPNFVSTQIPMTGPERNTVELTLDVDGAALVVGAMSIGNPHCVVVDREPTEAHIRALGPRLETHPAFPRRTNVQIAQVLDRGSIRIAIWERGAGYTTASGSSSCAAASILRARGLLDNDVTVHCPGGVLSVHFDAAGVVHLEGPVEPIAQGFLDAAWCAARTPSMSS